MAVHDAVDECQEPVRYEALHAFLDLREQVVHAPEVRRAAASRAELDATLLARRDERDRQIAVDVRVHAGECELQRRDPGRRARRTAGPGRGRRRRAFVGLDGGEEEVGEDDVEPLEEGRPGEGRERELRVDALRHLAVQPREARDTVGARRRTGSRPAGRSPRERSSAERSPSATIRQAAERDRLGRDAMFMAP